MKVTNILFDILMIFSKIKYKLTKKNKEKKIIEDFSCFNEDYLKKLKFKYQPLLSIITPIYKPNVLDIKEYFASIFKYNFYKKLEFCFVIDGECDDIVIKYLYDIKNKYNILLNIKFNLKNEGISFSTNKAIYMSSGEYLLFVDQDDYLNPSAFVEILKVLQKDKYDFIYTDESIVNNGRHLSFNFKPNFSPHTLLSRMYTNHLSIYKRDIVLKSLPLKREYDGCQDYFLILRSLKYIKKIYHLNKVLYHWRMSNNSIAKDINNKIHIVKKTENLLKNYFKENNLDVNVKAIENKLIYNISFSENNEIKDIILVLINKNKECNFEAFKKIIINENNKYTNIFIFDKFYNKEIDIKLNKLDFFYYKEFNFKNLNKYLLNLSDNKIILFITTDIYLNYDFVKQLSLTLDIPKAGTVSPCLINEKKKILKSGGIINDYQIYYSGVNLKYGDSDYYGVNHSLVNYTLTSHEVFLIKAETYKLIKGVREYNFFKTIHLDICLKILKIGLYNIINNNTYAIKKETKITNKENICNKKDIFNLKNNWKKELLTDRFYNKNLDFKKNLLYKLK